ncbi:stage II sporulation protein M [Paenibacillus arenilitoris]|uniref:Stage II sporulation protein M n=1 Tax=Paenibacillus arenilitoris TaxID=2772299 RepID=A0A927CJW7_9BACL|nr:stage II sporulation protein M [Paenibacillus arenilitoris]MBD2867040.1 stage II sporulation protein M [Paenibacillus arenilitoris]
MIQGFKWVYAHAAKWRYLLIASSVLYGLAAIAGAVVGSNEPLQNTEGDIPHDPFYYLTHNSRSILLFLSGLLTFGMTSIFALFANGFMIGFSVAGRNQDTPLWATLMHIIPHGIFEIPAMLLAGAVGLYPLQLLVRYARNQRPLKIGWMSIVLSIVWIGALLIAAAFVEALISPAIIDWVT